MKQILLYIGLLLFAFTSCSDEMNSRHFNPDEFTDAKIEFLYTQGASRTIENEYADYYSYVFRMLGTYMQTVARKEGSGRASTYIIQDDRGRWSNYYTTRMQEFAEMDKKYKYSLSEAEREDYRPYIETAKVLKAFNTIITTDVMGSIPYTEAWGARNGLYGQPVNLTPKYESQKEIYYTIISELEIATEYLKNNTLNENIEKHRIFKSQDIVYNGNYSKWYKFANSMLLRAAMRISNVDEGKAKEVLSKLQLDNLIINNDDNSYTRVPNTAIAGSGVGIWRALRESQNRTNGEYAYAPQRMVKVFNDANDPRLSVYFQPPSDLEGNIVDKTKPILGYPESSDDAAVIVASKTAEEIRNTYGIVSSTTIRNNTNFPNGIGITASDVYFFLAEAQLRGLISWKSAEEFYNKGIILSIQEYYSYYKHSSETTMKDPAIANTDVSEETLSAWLSSSNYKYNEAKAMEQIATQKWLHTWILQPFENWAEYRRTDLPIMVDDREQTVLLNQGNTPTKFMYPASESTLNAKNFEAVKHENDSKARVWWDVK